MTRRILLPVIALGLFFAGCTKVKNLANINVNIPYQQQFAIPDYPGALGGVTLPPGGGTLPFPAVPVPTNSQYYLTQYHTSAEKIIKVGLKSLSLQILSPANQNFDFLDNVQVYISARTLPEMLLAYSYSVPKGVTTLDLATSTEVNLKDYFIQDTIYLRLSAHINATPLPGTQVNMASVFNLLANPLE